jgi:hypothetical protein
VKYFTHLRKFYAAGWPRPQKTASGRNRSSDPQIFTRPAAAAPRSRSPPCRPRGRHTRSKRTARAHGNRGADVERPHRPACVWSPPATATSKLRQGRQAGAFRHARVACRPADLRTCLAALRRVAAGWRFTGSPSIAIRSRQAGRRMSRCEIGPRTPAASSLSNHSRLYATSPSRRFHLRIRSVDRIPD